MNLGDTYDWIVDELGEKRSVSAAMANLIQKCTAARPHADWDQLANVRYGELDAALAWLQRPFVDEPHDGILQSLWVGVFNPVRNGSTVADMYVCGSERRASADDCDWAVSPEWWPDERYAHSRQLEAIYEIAYRPGGLGNDAEYPLCLGYAAFTVTTSLAQVEPRVILQDSEYLDVAVGFDSGDMILLGRLDDYGFEPRG